MPRELTLDEEAGFEIVADEVLGKDFDCDLLDEDSVGAISEVDTAHAATAE